MNRALQLLTRTDQQTLTTEEETELFHDLSVAYHLDESAAINPEVRRIAEKIRLRMELSSKPSSDTAKTGSF